MIVLPSCQSFGFAANLLVLNTFAGELGGREPGNVGHAIGLVHPRDLWDAAGWVDSVGGFLCGEDRRNCCDRKAERGGTTRYVKIVVMIKDTRRDES